MGTKFFSRPLLALGRILNLDQGRGQVGEFSTESPIQPVWDFRRLAEIASGLGSPYPLGYWNIAPPHVHAGGDIVRTAFDPRVFVAAQGSIPVTTEFDIWMLRAWTWCATPAVQNFASCAIQYPVLPGGGPGTNAMPVMAGAGAGLVSDNLGGGDDEALQSFALGFPFLLPKDSLVLWRTGAAVAAPGTIFPSYLAWIGPRGVHPPGLF